MYIKIMKRFYGKILDDMALIEGEEFIHLKSVLRLREGDEIVVINGGDEEYFCEISQIKKDKAFAKILACEVCKALPKKEIVLFQAVTKREKFELILQKSVELGVAKFVPFQSEFVAIKDMTLKMDRLEKIVIGACKQCECSRLTEISKTLSFEDMLKCANKLDIVIFANERDGENFDFSPLKDYQKIGIIVGPEGGFSESEKKRIIESGAKSVSLGKRILRSETASIVLTGLVGILSGN